MVQNISADGSQLALILDFGALHLCDVYGLCGEPSPCAPDRLIHVCTVLGAGAHHLDLMFSHPSNPTCFVRSERPPLLLPRLTARLRGD